MSRDYKLYLDDIISAIQKIRKYTVSFGDLAAFEKDEMAVEAVLYNLLTIGEAVKHIPDAKRASLSEVEWRKIAGLRDMIGHAYFSINLTIIWDVVQNKLDALEMHVNALLRDETDETDPS